MADASLAVASKICIKCHQKKSIENFCKKANNKDGHDNRCRDCQKARYHERIEYVLRNKKEYYEKNREKILADKVIYQQEPEDKPEPVKVARPEDVDQAELAQSIKAVLGGKDKAHS